MARRKKELLTHDGHKLSINEDRFIDKYLEFGNALQAVVQSGYKTKTPGAYGHMLLTKDYIANEIKYRRDDMHSKNIASAQEVMDYFTKVMRGELLDQFGLEAPLSERTKAAQELAKRTVDIDNRMAGKKNMETPDIKIVLDWKRDKEVEENGEE